MRKALSILALLAALMMIVSCSPAGSTTGISGGQEPESDPSPDYLGTLEPNYSFSTFSIVEGKQNTGIVDLTVLKPDEDTGAMLVVWSDLEDSFAQYEQLIISATPTSVMISNGSDDIDVQYDEIGEADITLRIRVEADLTNTVTVRGANDTANAITISGSFPEGSSKFFAGLAGIADVPFCYMRKIGQYFSSGTPVNPPAQN